ncbi:hypothetical protein MBT84_27215 [Streptomyces sp. MBT84]|nr:hypothetical protein [Streptomyces sp. MBT84]
MVRARVIRTRAVHRGVGRTVRSRRRRRAQVVPRSGCGPGGRGRDSPGARSPVGPARPSAYSEPRSSDAVWIASASPRTSASCLRSASESARSASAPRSGLPGSGAPPARFTRRSSAK